MGYKGLSYFFFILEFYLFKWKLNNLDKNYCIGGKKKERKRNIVLKDGIIFYIFVNLKDKG